VRREQRDETKREGERNLGEISKWSSLERGEESNFGDGWSREDGCLQFIKFKRKKEKS